MCDGDGDGVLKEEEMRTFAELTGFDGSREAWAEEYVMLCSESGVNPALGIGQDLFVRLLNDESEMGQYCTDEELREML
eukprot:CAMPEP_0195125380 /NCGR_PEP_ID=MMETSP0448-20130528/132876_1 /TAXON_ID=66468 /ORGANISM="Heterocapsa triquestra, Strain CCMP 448" /LENGTH=78 /DNA_ID=CAMNT_0040163011 /DNA_START=14 /DNA_END=247 /DNA_ORIENTATION=-